MNSATDTTLAPVQPGTPGYVAPEQYKPIVDAQVAMIEAYLAALAAPVVAD